MDKVNGSTSQAMPLWDRQKNQRGHYSSVDKALQAHRQRKAERHERVEQRLNMVRNQQNNFFPGPNLTDGSNLIESSSQVQSANSMVAGPQNTIEVGALPLEMIKPETTSFQPLEMDELYSEASFGSVADNALGLVQKEVANPEDIPTDEVPKGSYVDYTV